MLGFEYILSRVRNEHFILLEKIGCLCYNLSQHNICMSMFFFLAENGYKILYLYEEFSFGGLPWQSRG